MKTTVEFLSSWVQCRVRACERGASLIEYALLLALIAVVCIAAVTTLGTGLRDNYTESNASIFSD